LMAPFFEYFLDSFLLPLLSRNEVLTISVYRSYP
jgi:hypothetical protein